MTTKVIKAEIDLSEDEILNAIWAVLAKTPLGNENGDVKNMIVNDFLDIQLLHDLNENDFNNLGS